MYTSCMTRITDKPIRIHKHPTSSRCCIGTTLNTVKSSSAVMHNSVYTSCMTGYHGQAYSYSRQSRGRSRQASFTRRLDTKRQCPLCTIGPPTLQYLKALLVSKDSPVQSLPFEKDRHIFSGQKRGRRILGHWGNFQQRVNYENNDMSRTTKHGQYYKGTF